MSPRHDDDVIYENVITCSAPGSMVLLVPCLQLLWWCSCIYSASRYALRMAWVQIPDEVLISCSVMFVSAVVHTVITHLKVVSRSAILLAKHKCWLEQSTDRRHCKVYKLSIVAKTSSWSQLLNQNKAIPGFLLGASLSGWTGGAGMAIGSQFQSRNPRMDANSLASDCRNWRCLSNGIL